MNDAGFKDARPSTGEVFILNPKIEGLAVSQKDMPLNSIPSNTKMPSIATMDVFSFYFVDILQS